MATATASHERRAGVSGDEHLMDAVMALATARRSYAAAGARVRAETIQAIRELLVSECNALNTREND